MDGMVLCADSLENDGDTKRFVDKLWRYEVQGDWGIALATAGEADLADSFTQDLAVVLGDSDFDEERLLLKLRTAIRGVRRAYMEAEFGFLAAIYGRPVLYRKVFRVTDGSSHLGPVGRYQALGVGSPLANFLADQLYVPSMCVKDVVRLAAFILARVKECNYHCGGDSSIMSCGGIGEEGFSFRQYGKEEIENIEKELNSDKLRAYLEKFWVENNPSPQFERIRPRRSGGGSHGVLTAKLNTRP
jgi:hypothetical protein